jgi:hypothetical protein
MAQGHDAAAEDDAPDPQPPVAPTASARTSPSARRGDGGGGSSPGTAPAAPTIVPVGESTMAQGTVKWFNADKSAERRASAG